MVHIVAYDLKSPYDTEGDYRRVIDNLKAAYPTWCHLEQSVWLIQTEQLATEVRDTVKVWLHSSDHLFVARLEGNWGSFNLGSNRSEWIKGRSF